MKSRLVNANVVVVADKFNPSIFNQIWLTKNNIVLENDFGDNCLFTPVITQVECKEFVLLVVPEQLQFTLRRSIEDEPQLIIDKVGTIIQKLSHTPYVAIGLNFIHRVQSDENENRSIYDLTKYLFYKEDISLFKFFGDGNSRFGSYLSRDILGGRLKLDIKPVAIVHEDSSLVRHDTIQFNFNFHFRITGENVVDSILEYLGKWNEAKQTGFQIMEYIKEVQL